MRTPKERRQAEKVLLERYDLAQEAFESARRLARMTGPTADIRSLATLAESVRNKARDEFRKFQRSI